MGVEMIIYPLMASRFILQSFNPSQGFVLGRVPRVSCVKGSQTVLPNRSPKSSRLRPEAQPARRPARADSMAAPGVGPLGPRQALPSVT